LPTIFALVMVIIPGINRPETIAGTNPGTFIIYIILKKVNQNISPINMKTYMI
jgi:hypothetical protein